MREYGGDIHFICLEAENTAKNDSVSKSSSMRHSHCLAKIAFILDIYLWCHVLWRFNHNYVEP